MKKYFSATLALAFTLEISGIAMADERRDPGEISQSPADNAQCDTGASSGAFALILSEARKYGLTLTIGHQYLDQLPDRLRAAVFGNVGSFVACRPGAADAPILAEQIGLGGPDGLLDLPNFTAWARLLKSGVPTSPLRLTLNDAPRPRRHAAHRLIATSRMRFGRPRAEVEARIRKFLGS